MTPTLEQLLVDLREEAQVLGRTGDARGAALLHSTVDRLRDAAEDFITWLSEDDAMLRSGHHVRWLRARYAEWETQGHAKRERGKRFYRQCVIPLRANLSAAREAGRAEARRMAS